MDTGVRGARGAGGRCDVTDTDGYGRFICAVARACTLACTVRARSL